MPEHGPHSCRVRASPSLRRRGPSVNERSRQKNADEGCRGFLPGPCPPACPRPPPPTRCFLLPRGSWAVSPRLHESSLGFSEWPVQPGSRGALRVSIFFSSPNSLMRKDLSSSSSGLAMAAISPLTISERQRHNSNSRPC